MKDGIDSRATEAQNMQARYTRRDAQADARRYGMDNPYAFAAWQERLRRMRALLVVSGRHALHAMDVLEVGCGNGGNLQDLLRMGVVPARLAGVELMADRAARARELLPADCRIWQGDALAPDMQRHIAPGSQDLIVLFTVFSSILAPDIQQQLAQRVWQWLKPGGAVLWHDFVYDNPRNPDVRGVSVKQLRALFPQAHLQVQRATLAPPIGRVACRVSPALYPVLNTVPWLRTHVLCLLSKPGLVPTPCHPMP